MEKANKKQVNEMTVQRIKAIIKKMIKPTDRTEKYWKKAASKDVESVMESICDHFDKKTFDTKKEALIFSQNIKFDKNMKQFILVLPTWERLFDVGKPMVIHFKIITNFWVVLF